MRAPERRRAPALHGQPRPARRRDPHRPDTVARRVDRIDRFDAAFVKLVLWSGLAVVVVIVVAALVA